MTDSCIECGKPLQHSEIINGFCGHCQVKINNDFKIIDEILFENEFLNPLYENIFKN